jgi:hypothetical protein
METLHVPTKVGESRFCKEMIWGKRKKKKNSFILVSEDFLFCDFCIHMITVSRPALYTIIKNKKLNNRVMESTLGSYGYRGIRISSLV